MAETFKGTVCFTPEGKRCQNITGRIEGDTGDIIMGGNGVDGDLELLDCDCQLRLRLDAKGQRIEILNSSGEIIATIGGNGNVRAGTNGEGGNLFLYPEDATDIFENSDATVRANANRGDLTLGGNDTGGTLLLRDRQGTVRARMQAGSQRLELLDSAGEIISMIGGAGNLRAGSNGESGNLFLYPSDARNIFNNGQSTASISATSANMVLGDNGTDGSVFLQDRQGQTRARLLAESQRAEFLNREGETISMIGGSANMRAGTNGETGNLFLYPPDAENIFNNDAATASIDAGNANIVMGDHGTDGSVFLQDRSGQTRARMLAGSQRAEFLSRDGEIIAMIGGGANVRVGTNGEAGNMYLYDAQAQDIFNNGQATIALNGQSGDIVLRNADCAEEFPLTATAVAQAGQIVRLAEDGHVTPSTDAYDRRVAGIVAGAGDLKPGLVLGRDESNRHAVPVAMMGRVWCHATANNGAIAIGDPLVSSEIVGHAMLGTDPARTIGAVIGKAMDPLDTGDGLIRVLVNLQ